MTDTEQATSGAEAIIKAPIVDTKPVLKSGTEKKNALLKNKFILAYLETGNATAAYLKCRKVSVNSAKTLGFELLKKIDFSELLEISGLTDNVIIEEIKSGLKATRPYGKDNYLHADNTARHNYLDTLVKLKKKLQPEQSQPTLMQGLQIVINK